MRNDIVIDRRKSRENLNFLREVHRENMQAINGRTKPERFFAGLEEHFLNDERMRLFTAYHENEPVASLLLFFYNQTVEYFMPAIREKYRTLQPLSLLIYEGMLDAVREGYTVWNWGGTWLSQKGVYDFKKKWGARETRYHYYISLFDDKSQLLTLSPERIQAAYPYFYVLPFNRLEALRASAGQ
jgi:lipid II:glycine glycyltransferase (peptidoglycan interpeptide bridge formation enzyme)